MTRTIFPLIVIIGLISCNTNTVTIDYFGQTAPGNTPIIFGKGVVSIEGRFEHGISFTPDTRELVFGVLNKDDFSGDIYYSNKSDSKWNMPEVFEPLKNESVFLPYFSPGGNSLLYAQSKPDTNNLYTTDIWRIEKSNGNWVSPKKIQSPLSSISREANACMTYDGTIYFSSNRNCFEKENCFDADLFYSKLIDNEYQNVQEVSEFISSRDEESVFISPKEEYIIFCRNTDNETLVDLFISYRDYDNNWLEPQVLDPTINYKDWDRRPFVSIDNRFLFFTRLQIGDKGLTESDIYWVSTEKVFKPFVFNPISEIEIKIGEESKISIPTDYFKDIDDEKLELRINQKDLHWISFDNETMVLTLSPNQIGEFEVIFSAIDDFSNRSEGKVKIIVEE